MLTYYNPIRVHNRFAECVAQALYSQDSFGGDMRTFKELKGRIAVVTWRVKGIGKSVGNLKGAI